MTIGYPQLSKKVGEQDLKGHMAKSHREFNHIVHNRNKADRERQIRMDQNLEKIASALTKKEPKQEPKEVNHSAVL